MNLYRITKISVIGIIVFATFSLTSCNMIFKQAIERKDLAERKVDTTNPVSIMIGKDLKFGEEWLKQPTVEILHIKAKDGIKLQGYYIPNTISSNKLAVLIHGFGADARMMSKYGVMYRKMGYNVFMADNRAHGKSGGQYVGMGWIDRLDYLIWLDTLTKRTGGNVQIVIHGISMGGATAMMMSGEISLPKQIKAIIEDCGYTSVNDEIKNQMKKMHVPRFPLLNMASSKTKRKAGYCFKEASALEAVKKSTTPTLFIHGGADDYNPIEMVHTLYEAATCPKELLIVSNALHAMSYHDNPELYSKTVKSFIEKYITE